MKTIIICLLFLELKLHILCLSTAEGRTHLFIIIKCIKKKKISDLANEKKMGKAIEENKLRVMIIFKSINSSVVGVILPPPPFPHQWLQARHTSVGIGLIKLTKPSNALNQKPLFKNFILQNFLQVLSFMFVWNKIFCSRNWAIFYIFFHLVWVENRCYSIKDSVFLVLFL